MLSAAVRKLDLMDAIPVHADRIALLFHPSSEGRNPKPSTFVWWNREYEKPFKAYKMETGVRGTIVDGEMLDVGSAGPSTIISEIHRPVSLPDVVDAIWNGVNVVDDSWVAYGFSGILFQRELETGSWADVRIPTVEKHLTAVCAHPDGGFLACGWDGTLISVVDGKPTLIETGTRAMLHGIVCDAAGNITVCGNDGTIVTGDRSRLHPIDVASKLSFYGVQNFNGQTYVSTDENLYTLEDDVLRAVDFDDAAPKTFWKVRATKNCLVAHSRKELCLFDGEKWERIV